MIYKRRAVPNPAHVKAMMDAGHSRLLAELLSMRGVTDAAEAAVFLAPLKRPIENPYKLHGMKAAVERVKQALAGDERIVVYGDYDADGITATCVLYGCLKDMGARVGYYLPNRHSEGYGLNEAAVRALAAEYTLMITVDCGITAPDEIALARELGMDVIVTDHHSFGELPECAACVFPGDTPLAGVGVAGKLVQALAGNDALVKALDLIAIGTISDIVPLTGENRALAAHGLRVVNEADKRPGIEALLGVASMDTKPLDEIGVAFGLAPRINAAGRMGDPSRGVELFLSGDMDTAYPIAAALNEENSRRRAEESRIFGEAVAHIDGRIASRQGEGLPEERAVIAVGEGWNAGVIGIVASRLVERYARPAFVFVDEGGVLTGSARSVEGVHLYNLLCMTPELFERFGGHAMAAGLTLRADRLETFRERASFALEQMDAALFVPSAVYDMELRASDVCLDHCDDIRRLSPMGQSNPQPVFLLRGMRVDTVARMGETHLRMRLRDDTGFVDAVAFRQAERIGEAEGAIDALVQIERNEWMGRVSARCIIKSFQRSEREPG